MNNTIDKQQLVEWLNEQYDIAEPIEKARGIQMARNKIQSGAFDIPNEFEPLLKANVKLLEERDYLREAIEIVKQIINDLHLGIGQDMDINPSAKRVYLSKIRYADEKLGDALNTSVTSQIKKHNFDKWYELRQFLKTGIEYTELPEDRRKAYSLAFNKMIELDEAEKRFNGVTEPSVDRVREIYAEWVAERKKPYDPNFPIYGPIVENRIAQIEEIAQAIGIVLTSESEEGGNEG